jgi:hypothetical protein
MSFQFFISAKQSTIFDVSLGKLCTFWNINLARLLDRNQNVLITSRFFNVFYLYNV